MIFLAIVIAVVSVIVVSLVIPLQVWWTGRLETPPLDLVSGGQLMSRSSRIWIDSDAACGTTPTTDPDDCLAILWLASNDPNILGISSSYGNANADVVERTTEALVATMGSSGLPRIPVWRGAAGPLANSGNATQPAHAALRAELEQSPLTTLALGPLTNIAAALDGRPDLQRNVARQPRRTTLTRRSRKDNPARLTSRRRLKRATKPENAHVRTPTPATMLCSHRAAELD
jgi:purine nucleosidase